MCPFFASFLLRPSFLSSLPIPAGAQGSRPWWHELHVGRGFGSPLFGWTGPTAWMGPIYPGLLAGVFKLFGTYSKASAYVILSLNSIFAALTCLPLHSIVRSVFGEQSAIVTAWAWALFPFSIDFAVE